MIDFDDTGYGWYQFDLAVAIPWGNEVAFDALREGYLRVRTVPKAFWLDRSVVCAGKATQLSGAGSSDGRNTSPWNSREKKSNCCVCWNLASRSYFHNAVPARRFIGFAFSAMSVSRKEPSRNSFSVLESRAAKASNPTPRNKPQSSLSEYIRMEVTNVSLINGALKIPGCVHPTGLQVPLTLA